MDTFTISLILLSDINVIMYNPAPSPLIHLNPRPLLLKEKGSRGLPYFLCVSVFHVKPGCLFKHAFLSIQMKQIFPALTDINHSIKIQKNDDSVSPLLLEEKGLGVEVRKGEGELGGEHSHSTITFAVETVFPLYTSLATYIPFPHPVTSMSRSPAD